MSELHAQFDLTNNIALTNDITTEFHNVTTSSGPVTQNFTQFTTGGGHIIPSSHSSASGSADYGYLSGSASTDYTAPGNASNNYGGFLHLEFRDTVTISSPGLNFEQGRVLASGILHGHQEAFGNYSNGSVVKFVLEIGGTAFQYVPAHAEAPASATDLFADATQFYNFAFGVPFGVRGILEVSSGGNFNGPAGLYGNGEANAEFTWGGISEVREVSNSDNVLVTNYIVSSASGFDWLPSTVPEPSAALLLVVGAGCCLRRRTLRTHERSA